MEGYHLGKAPRNKTSRRKKAAKIIKVVEKHKPLKHSTVLDIGTGGGFIAESLAKKAQRVFSVDIVDYRIVKTGYKFKKVSDERLPFADNFFDVIVSNQVLEHLPDQHLHFAELKRVLKGDGMVYLASPNKWWLTDPHYKLPFISWLPHSLGTKYLKIVKKRTWDIHSLSLRQLRAFATEHGFNMEDAGWEILKKPERYLLKPGKMTRAVIAVLPSFSRHALLHIMPTHVKILRGNEN